MDDVLRDLPVPRAVHRVPEPPEALLVPGDLEPLVELALRLEREVERGRVIDLRAAVCEEPVRERAVDLRRLVRSTHARKVGEN